MARKDKEAFSKLPRPVVDDSTPGEAAWRAEVRAAAEGIEVRDAATLASLYEDLRAERDRLQSESEQRLRPVNAKIQALEELLPIAFEAGKLVSLRTVGHHVAIEPDVQTSVTDNDALIEWAKANGYERKLTLYAPTVKSIVVERVRSGEPLPPGVDVRGTERVSFRKA